MGILEDVLKALERVPMWKRVSALPEEFEALKKRVVELENRISPAAGEICPICRAPALKVIKSTPDPDFGFAGVQNDTLKCSNCSHQENRQRDPNKT